MVPALLTRMSICAAGQELRARGRYPFGFGQVEDPAFRGAAGGADLGLGLGEVVVVAVQHDVGAGLGQADRDRPADART